MALGEALENARLARKETASQVAAATRMKVQIIEALETEDFSKIPAPIYGKGFIKLYAEHVGLDAEPLIREYMTRSSASKMPSLAAESAIVREDFKKDLPKPDAETKAPGSNAKTGDDTEPDLFRQAGVETEKPSMKKAVASAGETGGLFENVGGVARDDTEPMTSASLEDSTDGATSEQDMRHIELPRAAEAPPEPTVELTGVLHIFQQTSDNIRAAGKAVGSSVGNVAGKAKTALRDGPFNLSNINLSDSPIKVVTLILGVILILVFLISGLSRCFIRGNSDPGADARAGSKLRVAVEPPTPFFD